MSTIEEVKHSQPTFGKVQLLLNDVFKLSRILGSFPIDAKFSGLSTFNLATGVIIYLSAATIAITLSCALWQEDTPLPYKLVFSMLMTLPTSFHLLNLSWLVTNRSLFVELYDDLKDIEYNLWENGVDWFHKPSWCTKYLSFVFGSLFYTSWEVLQDNYHFLNVVIVQHVTVPNIFIVLSQYLALMETCLSLFRVIRLLEESRTVIKLNEKVLALCSKVNALYERQLVFYILKIFVSNIFVIYINIIYYDFFRPNIIWILLSLFLAFNPLFLIIKCIGNISEEVLILYY